MEDSVDPRFHRRLLGTLAEFDEERLPCLIYVENGNFNSGYDMLALDYKMAADLIIKEEAHSGLGNWSAPLAFMVRQTLELSLKALLEATAGRGNEVSAKAMFSHKLDLLWAGSSGWLRTNGYAVDLDRRSDVAEWMVTNFHAVDPSGDLFRFATSKFTAFGRQKTYDRAGLHPKVLVSYFEDTYGFLRHWESVLTREWMKEVADENGHELPNVFDPEDFPRKVLNKA